MKHLFVLAIVLAAACGGKSKTPAAPDNGDGAGDTGENPPATGPFTLVSLQPGDTDCNVEVQGADGASQDFPGDFEVCEGGGKDATSLIGKMVTLRFEKGNVLAAECEGNMDCGKSETVDLVVEITAQ